MDVMGFCGLQGEEVTVSRLPGNGTDRLPAKLHSHLQTDWCRLSAFQENCGQTGVDWLPLSKTVASYFFGKVFIKKKLDVYVGHKVAPVKQE